VGTWARDWTDSRRIYAGDSERRNGSAEPEIALDELEKNDVVVFLNEATTEPKVQGYRIGGRQLFMR
jgi:hypothetical protein